MNNFKQVIRKLAAAGGRVTGVDEAALGWFAAQLAGKNPVCILAREHGHMLRLAEEIAFFNPKLNVQTLPAWDVQPYDRMAPDVTIQAARLAAMAALRGLGPKADVWVTTVNGISTKLPDSGAGNLVITPSSTYNHEKLAQQLVDLGFTRCDVVTEPGEFAIRGSVIDLFPIDSVDPVRLDFFDDDLESIRTFDPVSQRSMVEIKEVVLASANEVSLTPERVRLFREGYRNYFPQGVWDGLYESISSGNLPQMALHYLPLFFENKLPSFLDLVSDNTLFIAPNTFENALKTRQESIADAYETRLKFMAAGDDEDIYRPIPPEDFYLIESDWLKAKQSFKWVDVESFKDDFDILNLQLEGHQFGSALQQKTKAAVEIIKQGIKDKKDIYLIASTPAALSQMEKILSAETEQGLNNVKLKNGPLQEGFESPFQIYIAEQDILGVQQGSRRSRKVSGENVIASIADLAVGDYVVHEDHGVARFEGLSTMEIAGHSTLQDYLKLEYAGRDIIYVPIESLNLVSRFSSAEGGSVVLDKLGGAAWQTRKAKVKKDLMVMAGELMETAAARMLLDKQELPAPVGLYDDFCNTFPYQLTLEQKFAIDDVMDDMAKPHPMDRLVVGDVGFGKTEVALRAAMIAAGNGKQVAIVVPTTLLARQHYEVFCRRFAGFPINIAQLSRMITPTVSKNIKQRIKEGGVDVVIGTHALLGKGVVFKDLGLLVVDEEQRFGVSHKEKLKKLKANVDVLTLTATPIPRTMHMAMGGIKQLSTIATPPVDRLAVRSYVMKMDGKIIRDAVLREIHRGGQVYVVTPRVKDIPTLIQTLKNIVPEATVKAAHGQMPERELESVMEAFYHGDFQVLVATTIIESGLDIPTANTIIVNRADRFGLSQLHQLRGRVGRSTLRAYAYFLLPDGNVGELAQRRLKILQRLEGLGAGFQLASYDMDLRGAGNLVGKEQSGHMQTVGFELYSKLLADAVNERKAQKEGLSAISDNFSTTLNLGISYRVPENYVPDLSIRMRLYRRLAQLEDTQTIETFAEELEDRFGKLPQETKSLLSVVDIRNRSNKLNVDKLDVGPQGAVIRFHNNTFDSPEGLLKYIQNNAGAVTLNPDQTLTFHKVWGSSTTRRLKGVKGILEILENMC